MGDHLWGSGLKAGKGARAGAKVMDVLLHCCIYGFVRWEMVSFSEIHRT